MGSSWRDITEIVAGLVLTGKISDRAIRPETCYPPYDNLIKAMRRGANTPEKVMEIVGIAPVTAALTAIQNIDDFKTNWIMMLESAYATYSAGSELEEVAKKLKKNEDVDLSRLHSIAQKAISGQGKLTPASQVVAREIPFILSGYKPLDREMGGIPEVGLITVGGATKSGKTTWMIRLILDFLELYKDKFVVIFSIEMLQEELKMRMKEVEPKLEYEKDGEIVQDERLSRILIHDGPIHHEQIPSIAAQVENLGMVCIDFADLMIQGEASESKYAAMYVNLMLSAKTLHCPIVMLAQFNRQYNGKLPRPNNLRYTGLAEALSWMLITLWNPEIGYHQDSGEDEQLELPILEGKAYMIIWLCRGGFRKHPNDSPGAIAIEFKGERGWSPVKGTWYSLRKEPRRKVTQMK